MRPEQVPSQEALSGLSSDDRCWLSNQRKQVYNLKITAVDAAQARLSLERPEGRRDTLDPTDRWTLSFHVQGRTYQNSDPRIVPMDNVWKVALGSVCQERRRGAIRLEASGRNPTSVAFDYGSNHFDGLLLDVSMEGLGLQLEAADPCPVAVDQPIHNARFALRARQIDIPEATVAHITRLQDAWRVGLRFDKPQDAAMSALRQLIADWNESRRSLLPSS